MRDDDPLNPPEDREEQESEEQSESDEQPASDDGDESSSDDGDGDSGSTEAAGQKGSDTSDAEGQEITAPSVGPHTKIEREPPEERLDFDKISDTDAMGKEKKRKVVGGTYGPTRARVFATFATFFAVVAALVVGFYFLAKELDQPPKDNPAEAPWAQQGAEQKKPRPLQ